MVIVGFTACFARVFSLTIPKRLDRVPQTGDSAGDHSQAGEEVNQVAEIRNGHGEKKNNRALQRLHGNPESQSDPDQESGDADDDEQWTLPQGNPLTLFGFHAPDEGFSLIPVEAYLLTQRSNDVISAAVFA